MTAKLVKPQPPAPLAYSVIGVAAAIQVSTNTVENLIDDGSLIVRYVRAKRVILATELIKYLESLPYSRP